MYSIHYNLYGIALSPSCAFYRPKPSDSAALPNQIDMPRHITINYGIHYRFRSIAVSPDCLFSPAKLSNSVALSNQTGIALLTIVFTIAFVVLPSLPIVPSHQLNPPTALHSCIIPIEGYN